MELHSANNPPESDAQNLDLSTASMSVSGDKAEREADSGKNTMDAATLPPAVLPKDSISRVEPAARCHLQKVLEGQIEPMLVISGASGSGKSFVINLLNNLGVDSARRLITRPGRTSDADTDVHWVADNKDFDPARLHFAYRKYDNYYGFLLNDLTSSVKSGMRSAFIAGDLGKISPLIEAMNSVMPLMPVVSLRIETPLEIVKERLTKKREEAYAGEAALRNTMNNALEAWEGRQLRTLKSFHDVHTIVNISIDEYSRFSCNGLRPMSEALISCLVDHFISEAKRRSALMAQEILKPMTLQSIGRAASPELISALQDELIPAAQKAGLHPLIKGGLAVAIYLANSNVETPEGKLLPLLKQRSTPADAMRRVSNDIDWTIVSSEYNIERHLGLIRSLAGAGVELKEYLHKPVFNSLKASAVLQRQNIPEVELDLIAKSRVRPPQSTYCFEFVHDSLLNHYRREVKEQTGQAVLHLVPPETIILEKLIAGRGRDLGKFDLYDAVALLMTQPLCASVFKRVIELQKFDPRLDTPDSSPFTGAHSDHALNEIVSRRQSSTDGEFELPLDDTIDNRKRFAFIDAVLRGIRSARSELSQSVDLVRGASSLEELFGRPALEEQLGQLEKLLYYLAEFQIGRSDLFVKRNPESVQNSADFFEGLRKLVQRDVKESPNTSSEPARGNDGSLDSSASHP